MKRYRDLNLRAIREKADLDFAHFTYQKHMCSCCYGPKQLPKLYWKNRTIPNHDNYSYILFKNANNGSGTVTKEDWIANYTCIEWGNMTTEQLNVVCEMLLDQLGAEYIVAKPKSEAKCILIFVKSEAESFLLRNEAMLKEKPEFAHEILQMEEIANEKH